MLLRLPRRRLSPAERAEEIPTPELALLHELERSPASDGEEDTATRSGRAVLAGQDRITVEEHALGGLRDPGEPRGSHQLGDPFELPPRAHAFLSEPLRDLLRDLLGVVHRGPFLARLAGSFQRLHDCLSRTNFLMTGQCPPPAVVDETAK